MAPSLFSIRRPTILSPCLASFQRLVLPVYGRNIATSHRKLVPIEYMPSEEVEKPFRYRPGGYHPISIGDRLYGRYDIVHKLGFGTYSTTWLARDMNVEKYVAIKIAIADADMQESKLLDTLALSALSNEGKSGEALIPRLLDTFLLDGPNGRHRCLVTEPGMMTLAEAKDASYTRLFRMPVAKAIAAQVIQAVASLHRRGVVHAGMYTHPTGFVGISY